MTPKDNNAGHDAEFDAFLQGRGDLAEFLQALPQPTPSDELDAAILADAERAIKRDAGPMFGVANDSFIPAAQRMTPRYFSRWKVPLGLAASFLLAMTIFMQQRQGNSPDEGRIVVATAPESINRAAPSAQPAKSVADEMPSMQANKDAGYSKQENTALPEPAGRAAAQNAIGTGKISQTGAVRPELKDEDFPKNSAKAKKSETRRVETLVAQAPAPVVAALAQERLVMADQSMDSARLRTQETAGRVMAEKTSVGGAEADMRVSKSNRRAAPPADVRETAPIAPPMPSTMGFAAASAFAPAQSGVPAANEITGAKLAAVPLEYEPSPEKAKKWLAQIEKLIKTDMRKEALDEWTNFRKSYPNYPVQEPLKQRLETLKK